MLANAFRHVFSPPCLMQQESEEQHYLAHGKETRNTPSKVTTIKTFLKCFRSGEYTAQRLPSTLALHQSSYVPLALPAAVLPAFPHSPTRSEQRGWAQPLLAARHFCRTVQARQQSRKASCSTGPGQLQQGPKKRPKAAFASQGVVKLRGAAKGPEPGGAASSGHPRRFRFAWWQQEKTHPESTLPKLHPGDEH